MNATNLYREEILDHYQNPHNFGRLEKFDVYARQTNPLCGDDIEMWVKFDKVKPKKYQGVNVTHPQGEQEQVKDASFLGKGCAICISGASMLTNFAKGRSKKELTKFSERDMLDLLAIDVSETRKKCALLSLAVLKDCLA